MFGFGQYLESYLNLKEMQRRLVNKDGPDFGLLI